MKALILNETNLVVDVAEKENEVAPTLHWMDCPDDCIPGWALEDGVLVAPPAPPEKTYDQRRAKEYPQYGDQLDDLFHTGGFFTDEMTAKIEAVKTKWPKDNSGPV